MKISGALALVAGALMGCGGATSQGDDTSGAGADPSPLLAGTQLSQEEVAQHLTNAGFPRSVIPQMVCTAKYESDFFTKALNTNQNGSKDLGLFQINNRLWEGPCGMSTTDLYDPALNAQCAKIVYDSGGLRSWYGYQHHKTTCDHFTIQTGP